MKKKIMIVEDDDFFRKAVKNILSKKYEVIEASNGKMARELIIMSMPDLVISDIQMPYFSGVELLEWVKEHNKSLPVILMTGFSQILETTRAHDLGAADFLPKPFKETEVTDKVSKIFNEKDEPTEDLQKNKNYETEFYKLPIEDFLTERDTEYGIFIKVAENKYIKIAHKGGKIPEDKIKSFKDKGVFHLYVKQEDFFRLVGFTLLFSKAVNASDKIDSVKKARFMQYTGSLIVQQAFVAGTDDALFAQAKDFIMSSLSIITENSATFDMLEQLNMHTDYLYAHSLGVSVYAVMIAKQMGLNSPQTHFKLSFAGLFHDIGLKELSKETLEKSRIKQTQQERTMFETHSTRSKEILEAMHGIPSDVIQIAYQHHEDILGMGYPQRLEKNKLHPLSLIVAVADAFCNLTIKNPNNEVAMEASYAYTRLLSSKKGSLDQQCLDALGRVIKSKVAMTS